MTDYFPGSRPDQGLAADLQNEVTDLLRYFFSKKTCPAVLLDGFSNKRIPEEPTSPVAYLAFLRDHVIRHAVDLSSPRCLGHMSNVVPEFAIALNQLVAGMNQNLVKRDASLSLSLLERETAGLLHHLVFGRPEEFYRQNIQNDNATLAITASGGTLANITALWIARNRALAKRNGFEGVEKEGISAALEAYGYEDAVIVGSMLMHYSFDKAAALLGIGERNAIKLPVDEHRRCSLSELRRALDRCRARRQCVIALVGIAGTTDCGSVDSLGEMADIAAEAGVHYHIDAAWGAALLFSRRHRGKLSGIERADTVTADGHKQLFLPIGTSMLLLREPHIARAIEKETRYMLQAGSGDPGRRSLEGSRPGTILLLHAALNIFGRAGFERLIDDNIEKAAALAEMIRANPAFELLNEPQTNILLYRFLPNRWRATAHAGIGLPDEAQAEINQLNEAIQKQQALAGRTFVSRTTIEQKVDDCHRSVVALRAVVSNPFTTTDDFQAVLLDQISIAATLEKSQ